MSSLLVDVASYQGSQFMQGRNEREPGAKCTCMH